MHWAWRPWSRFTRVNLRDRRSDCWKPSHGCCLETRSAKPTQNRVSAPTNQCIWWTKFKKGWWRRDFAQAASEYQAGRTFVFDDVHLFQTIPAINLKTQKSLSLHVNTPSRCMKGLMLLFVKVYAAGARDAEQFIMPLGTDVSVTIDGVPHKLFSDGMKSTDLWKSIKQKVGYDKRLHGHFKEQDFHNDKFAFWVDLRASPDNWLHGDGLIVGRSKDGVRLETSWTERNGVIVNCYAFVVADAALFVKEGRVKQFFLQPGPSDYRLRRFAPPSRPSEWTVTPSVGGEKKRDGKNTNSFSRLDYWANQLRMKRQIFARY